MKVTMLVWRVIGRAAISVLWPRNKRHCHQLIKLQPFFVLNSSQSKSSIMQSSSAHQMLHKNHQSMSQRHRKQNHHKRNDSLPPITMLTWRKLPSAFHCFYIHHIFHLLNYLLIHQFFYTFTVFTSWLFWLFIFFFRVHELTLIISFIPFVSADLNIIQLTITSLRLHISLYKHTQNNKNKLKQWNQSNPIQCNLIKSRLPLRKQRGKVCTTIYT